jgi:hypothetical protein
MVRVSKVSERQQAGLPAEVLALPRSPLIVVLANHGVFRIGKQYCHCQIIPTWYVNCRVNYSTV